MGKTDEEQPLSLTVGSELTNQNVGGRSGYGYERIRRIVGLRCLLALVLSAAVFLSAVFWLPPLFHYSDQKDLDIDSQFKDYQIVASFNVEKSVSFLEEHVLQLEDDIFEEIPVPSARVIILSMEPLVGSNLTEVVFAVDPERSYSEIPETSLSLIRSSFETLVLNRPPLRLTTVLFGKPVSFKVLKFHGGITIIPPQSAFLLQKVQIYFNFTLNFSIYQIQSNFKELTIQLKSGLSLAPYENMYIRLSNSRGSTVGAPTIVQCSVLLSVGNTPSTRRLKQLAQTITGSHLKNLGLNNTVFGKVKQVRLSSILNHSLSGGNGNGPTSSPSPAPDHSSHHHHRHHHHHHHLHHHHHHHHHLHHHHHHHRHHHNYHIHLAPAISPSPWTGKCPPGVQIGASAPEDGSLAPQISSLAPKRSYEVKPRSKVRKMNLLAPAPSLDISPKYSTASPRAQTNPRPPASPTVLPSSPLPNAIYAQLQPPSVSDHGKYMTPSVASSPSPSPSPSLASFAHST